MIVYYCGWALAIGTQFFVFLFKGETRKRVQSITIFILIAYFFAISAFRSVDVGTDLITYANRYSTIGETSWSNLYILNSRWKFEYGFLALCKILYFINPSIRFFIIVTSGFIIGSFARVIMKYSRLPNLSFFLFSLFAFWETSFNLIRLFIALGICLFSVESIIRKDFFKFLIIIIVASLFHTTALCFIPLYFFYHYFKINDTSLIVFAIACVFARIFAEPILNILMSLFSSIYSERYSSLIGSGSGYGMLALFVIIFLFCYFERDKIQEKDSMLNLWLSMFLLTILFNMLAFELEIAARIMWFTKIGILFLVPNTIYALSTRKSNSDERILNIIFIFGSCVLPIFLYYIRLMATDNAGVVPYIFGGF